MVDESCLIWDPMKDQVTDLEKIKQNFGLPPERLRDVMALSGDSADNIPGIPGVGPKTALKLVREYGSVERLLDEADKIPQKKLRQRLLEHGDRVALWKKLVTLDDSVPVKTALETYRLSPPDSQRLRELFTRFEFTRLLKEITPEKTVSSESYTIIQDENRLTEWIRSADTSGSLVIDTETDSENPLEAALAGISLCVNPPGAVYIPVGHVTESPQLPLDTVRRLLNPVLSDPEIRKIGQNIKYDMIVLERHGFSLDPIGGDTMIASYLLDPSRRQHNLDYLAQELLGHKMISFDEVTHGQGKKRNFTLVPLDRAMEYSCEDVHVTALAHEILRQKLEEAGLSSLYEDVEVPLIRVLARMEETGILVDTGRLARLSGEFEQRLRRTEQDIYSAAGETFNINSHKQLAHILFEKLNLPCSKKTRKKTAYSTDMDVLTDLARDHEIARLLVSYRNLAKLKSTYIDGLGKMLDPSTGRVHTSFNQTVTATGRLSSSNPNLQNIPVRTEEGRRIRALFIAGPGQYLLSADYSQIDLRVLAHYSGDEALMEAFRTGQDIHTRTAAQVFGIDPAFVTPDMRRMAKTVNFGIIYGMSAWGLARELGMERKKASEFINRYFDRYPGVRKYMNDTVKMARKQGQVTTILGRRRLIPEIRSRIKSIREFAERTAINTPIQGSAADIIKLAMLRVHEYLENNGLRSKMLLQVHDELVLEVPDDELDRVKKAVSGIMESAITLSVPLTVNISCGKNWAEMR